MKAACSDQYNRSILNQELETLWRKAFKFYKRQFCYRCFEPMLDKIRVFAECGHALCEGCSSHTCNFENEALGKYSGNLKSIRLTSDLPPFHYTGVRLEDTTKFLRLLCSDVSDEKVDQPPTVTIETPTSGLPPIVSVEVKPLVSGTVE